jgi:2-hydroxy-3-keto-5-methylthiopentenyl-1-phosphate phosphatase
MEWSNLSDIICNFVGFSSAEVGLLGVTKNLHFKPMNLVPPYHLNHVYIITDFDGVITDCDTLEILLQRFGTPEWLKIEQRLEQGLLTVDEAFQQQMGLLKVSLEEALTTLNNEVKIDITIYKCAKELLANGGQFTIASAGFYGIISNLLNGAIPEGIAIHANQVEVKDSHWKVIPSPTPKLKGLCTHCKRYWVENAKKAGDFVIYVGDGFTDRCPAEAADRVYARGSLLTYRQKKGLPTYPFRDFEALLEDIKHPSLGTCK